MQNILIQLVSSASLSSSGMTLLCDQREVTSFLLPSVSWGMEEILSVLAGERFEQVRPVRDPML